MEEEMSRWRLKFSNPNPNVPSESSESDQRTMAGKQSRRTYIGVPFNRSTHTYCTCSTCLQGHGETNARLMPRVKGAF